MLEGVLEVAKNWRFIQEIMNREASLRMRDVGKMPKYFELDFKIENQDMFLIRQIHLDQFGPEL